jgi:CheY-like chemotaxis protein
MPDFDILPHGRAMPTVLIVDDADATRAGLVRLFQLRGYTTREAVNGAEGLQRLREEPTIDVVVLDLMMPGTNGYWFRDEQLKDPALAGIPVIVFTGTVEAETLRRRLGVAEVFSKPVSVDAVFAAVSRHCQV